MIGWILSVEYPFQVLRIFFLTVVIGLERRKSKEFFPTFIFLVLMLPLSFLQILTELEHSGVGRIKEQSARMLGHLVSNAPRLIRPYMEPILKVESLHFLVTLK